MRYIFQFIANYNLFFIIGILFIFSLSEALFGYFSNSKRSKNDLLIESTGTFFLMVITKPLMMYISFYVMSFIFPNSKNVVSNWSLVVMTIVFLLVDDFLQYWYHRSAHKNKFLWKLHRPHHAATEMGFLISYRESVFFYWLMPNMWWLGIFTYLGGGVGVLVGVVLKQIIIIASHSLVTWDSFFHKKKYLTPILNFIERIFITPAFHHAHHAVSIVDGVGNPDGNFGNMFSFWDQLFGSAKYTHSFPKNYGIESGGQENWAAHTFYPVITSNDNNSEISRNYEFEKTTKLEPTSIQLNAGDYLYCQCGFSKNQPFCDGSHHGTKFQPKIFSIKKAGNYKLCNCKLTNSSPFCDNTHLKQKNE